MQQHQTLLNELKAAERKYGKFEFVEALIPDLSGVLRGKQMRRGDFEKVLKNGFHFCAGATLLTTLGETVSGIPYGEDDGDPDLPAEIVPGSIAPVPWATRPTGQALFRMNYDDGSRFFADPRQVVEHALAPLRKMRIQPVIATELEFYLLADSTSDIRPAVPLVPGTNRIQPGPQVYNPDDLYAIEPFLNDVYAYSRAQDVPAESAISEYAPGQFEVNLRHVADPVLACDHAVLLKRIVKAAARKHGFIACFMAKPFADDAGNGLHIHMSLLDKNGNNYFSQGRDSLSSPPFSARLRHAVGGLLKLMPEATLLGAPNANSYRRLRPDVYAPVEPNWGVNHRSVSIRIPQSDAKNLRFEHRTAGADANPYLVTAGVLAAVHYGIKNKTDPGKMVQQSEHIKLRMMIPNRLEKAIEKFSRSKILPDYLGAEYCRCYALNRRAESERFNNVISEVDFDWYLRAV